MATAQQLSTAINSRDIPIDVVPDYQVGGANYGQELVNQQPAGTYKYGSGLSTYLSVAPGTKTLSSKQFDESKRAQAAAEDLAERQFQEDMRANRIAEALAARKASSGGSSGLTAYQELQLMMKQQKDFDTNVNKWVTKIMDETSPVTKQVSVKDTQDNKTFKTQKLDSKFYYNGHAYPKQALSTYKSLMDPEVYQEVYRQIMGTFPKATANGVETVSDAQRNGAWEQYLSEKFTNSPDSYFK